MASQKFNLLKIENNFEELALKHYDEYKESYTSCFESLEKCDEQLNHLRAQVTSCEKSCEIDQQYVRGNGRFKTLIFGIKK